MCDKGRFICSELGHGATSVSVECFFSGLVLYSFFCSFTIMVV